MGEINKKCSFRRIKSMTFSQTFPNKKVFTQQGISENCGSTKWHFYVFHEWRQRLTNLSKIKEILVIIGFLCVFERKEDTWLLAFDREASKTHLNRCNCDSQKFLKKLSKFTVFIAKVCSLEPTAPDCWFCWSNKSSQIFLLNFFVHRQRKKGSWPLWKSTGSRKSLIHLSKKLLSCGWF